MLASALTVMSGAVVAPALPRIAANFLGDPDVALKSRLLLTLPALGVVLAGGLAGWAADRFGRLPVMQVSLVVYAVAGSTGLYLEGLDPLLMGRLVLGLGVAGIMTTATTLVADLWPGPARMRFLGLQAAFMGLGGLVFMTGGGALADQHWRAPFALYLASLLLLVPALVSFRVGAPSTLPAGGLVGMPAEGDKAPTFLIYLAAMLGYGLFYAIPTQLPFSLQERLQASSLQVGLAVGSSTVVSAVFSLMSQRIIARLGAPRTVALTFALVTAGFALLARHRLGPRLSGRGAVGAGTGLLMPNRPPVAVRHRARPPWPRHGRPDHRLLCRHVRLAPAAAARPGPLRPAWPDGRVRRRLGAGGLHRGRRVADAARGRALLDELVGPVAAPPRALIPGAGAQALAVDEPRLAVPASASGAPSAGGRRSVGARRRRRRTHRLARPAPGGDDHPHRPRHRSHGPSSCRDHPPAPTPGQGWRTGGWPTAANGAILRAGEILTRLRRSDDEGGDHSGRYDPPGQARRTVPGAGRPDHPGPRRGARHGGRPQRPHRRAGPGHQPEPGRAGPPGPLPDARRPWRGRAALRPPARRR
ncbi:MAG: MFS transporter [bacterium]